jgi:hypothetical protein
VDFLALVEYLDTETFSSRPLDPFFLDDSVLGLQHQLIRCNVDELAPLDRAFRAACLIFIKCLIKKLNVVSQTSTPLMTQIRDSIGTCEDVPQPLFIWLLFMGLVAGPPLHEGRILLCSMLVNHLKLQDGKIPAWNELKGELRKIAWVDAILDRVGESLCSELDAVALV